MKTKKEKKRKIFIGIILLFFAAAVIGGALMLAPKGSSAASITTTTTLSTSNGGGGSSGSPVTTTLPSPDDYDWSWWDDAWDFSMPEIDIPCLFNCGDGGGMLPAYNDVTTTTNQFDTRTAACYEDGETSTSASMDCCGSRSTAVYQMIVAGETCMYPATNKYVCVHLNDGVCGAGETGCTSEDCQECGRDDDCNERDHCFDSRGSCYDYVYSCTDIGTCKTESEIAPLGYTCQSTFGCTNLA